MCAPSTSPALPLWRDGRLGVSRNPTGADQGWRCPAKAAGAIVRAANANGKDVTAATARPGEADISIGADRPSSLVRPRIC